MPKSLWFLLIGVVINTTGSSFLWPLNTIYIHDVLGHSLTFAGSILMLNSAAGMAGNMVGGMLYDKIGGYRSVLGGLFFTTAAGGLLVFFHGTLSYSILLVFIGFGTGMIFPPIYALAGSVWPEGGRRPFNAVYVAQNLGVALGTSFGGFVAGVSYTYTFAANALLFLCYTVFAGVAYRNIEPKKRVGALWPPRSAKAAAPARQKEPLIALGILCIGLVLCWLAYVQWSSTIAAYTQTLHIPIARYSLLWTINGLLIVLGQPIVSWVTQKMPSLKAQMLTGIAIFALSFFILFFARTFAGFALAMVVLTFGEMLVWPAVPTIASRLAPEGKAGFYQGVVNSAGAAGRMIGPLVGGILVDVLNMHALILILLFVYVGAAVTAVFYDRPLQAGRRLDRDGRKPGRKSANTGRHNFYFQSVPARKTDRGDEARGT
ncbi:MDR family MFS transporter [Caenibacillus caldisaponilyticus]|uniref:MDR family MFS transporter n=1 Tax=Caenibacillus caldisaponilyticus TaxID=1674942 RepID=UPI00098868C5|nr:MFS transporter [Caenibacillus caldisaponilyticus]